MRDTLLRMKERCDPYVYYTRVRPYIHGWKNSPSLPDGLIYDQVEAYAQKPQQFRGETGAQSSIVPCLDAGLGIHHAPDPLIGIPPRDARVYAAPTPSVPSSLGEQD